MNIKGLVKKPINALGYDLIRQPKDYVKNPQKLEVNYGWLVHFFYFKELFDRINPLSGDVVECGVGFGRTFFKLCCLAQIEKRGRQVIGFDSFAGFPEPSEEDSSSRNPKKGQWNVASPEMVMQLLKDGGINPDFLANNIKIIKGFFNQSLRVYSGDAIVFLHLDVDLYQSYKDTLEYFWPKIPKGGVVLFDEYKQPECLEKFPGASKAIDEFFGRRTSHIQFHQAANKYYIIKQ